MTLHIGQVFVRETGTHRPLGLLHRSVEPGGDRREHRRTQGASLIAGHHPDRNADDIGHRLHHERRFAGDAADGEDVVDGHPLFEHPLVDGPGPEDRSFDQRLVNRRRRCRKGQSVQRTPHPGVGIGRPAAVVPVERHGIVGCQGQPFGLGRQLPENPLFELRIASGNLPQRPRHHPPEPGVQISEGSLPGLETDISGQHRTIDLTADAAHGPVADLVVGADHNVARRGSHHLDQRSGDDPGPDGPDMAVDGPHADGDARFQPQPGGPLAAQPADARIARDGVGIKMSAEDAQQRIDRLQKLRRGKSAPRGVPHRLVSGHAAAAGDGLGGRVPDQQGADPVAVLHPRIGRSPQSGRTAQAMEHLGPHPFAGVGAAAVTGVIDLPLSC